MRRLLPLALLLLAGATHAATDLAAAREHLRHSHGNQRMAAVVAERLELQPGDGSDLTVWDAHAWVGGDEERLWLGWEGELENSSGALEEAELQALYSRAVHPFWNLGLGLRHDVRPEPERTHAVVRVTGIAPYWVHVDAAAFVSHKGDVSVRLELEYEVLLTQNLSLEPHLEMDAGFSGDRRVGLGSGFRELESGLRLRYAFMHELSAYLGLNWSRKLGDTRRLARLEGEDGNRFGAVVGVSFWW